MATRVTDVRNDGDYTTVDDRLLVLDFQAGHPEAFVEIHRRYGALAKHVCRRFLSNAADAEEAHQETMIRVFQGLFRFNGQYALQPWIARIATNVSLDQIRTRARRPQVDDATLEEHEREDTKDGPDVLVERLLERDLVLSVLTDLPESHRTALVLRELEGRSHKEIAEAMGITPAQAKALIHRAKASFRRSWLLKMTERGGLAGFALMPLVWLLRATGSMKRVGSHIVQVGQVAQAATPEIVTSTASVSAPMMTSFTERAVAAGMTLLLAGGVTVGAATIAKRGSDPDRTQVITAPETVAPQIAPAPVDPPADDEPAQEKPAKAQHHGVQVPPATEDDPTPVVDPSPTEAPEPSTPPDPTPTDEPSPPPPTVPPAPAWTGLFAISWSSQDDCGCGSGISLGASSSTGDLLTPEGSLDLTQAFGGAATDAEGDGAWAVDADLRAHLTRTDGSIDLSFDLENEAGKTHFLGTGQVSSVTGDAGAGEALVFSVTGTYTAVAAAEGSSPVPTSGGLAIQIGVWEDGSTAYITAIRLLS